MSGQALKDKVVVVIGGTSGLGLSGTIACFEAGAKVVTLGRDQDQVAKTQEILGENGFAFAADATDPETPTRAVQEAIRRFGKLDALYHVAGGSGRRFGDGPLHEVTDLGIEKTIELNLNPVIRSNRAAVQAFRAQGTGGTILNMGSVLGHSPSKTYFSTAVYAATKAAVEGFTLSCSAYYAKEDIRFNVICPALVLTDMATRAAEDENILKFIKTKQPLDGGRPSLPDDLNQAVIFLLSSDSKLVTGQVLNVDGGWCVSEGQIS
ncbi:MAG: SDR family oxidoreductase [Fimbriimonadaceae bacterium]|jgi:NAD(P)-dependent dehydrogenase (short-subunit alcohol dehydrogenase family)|nr:SDR family oxidoreductase [Fimbriimonadaceae bacterium]